MNNCILMGRIASDVTVRTANSGTTVANFRLAVRRPFSKDKTDFFNLTAFGKTAEMLEKYIAKGDSAAFECSAQTDAYTDRDGNKRSAVVFIVNSVDFGAKKGSGSSGGKDVGIDADTPANGSDGSGTGTFPDDDDLPF